MTLSSLSAQLAASQPRLRESTADQSSYFVRLGDLDPSFRQRAFEHALSHLQQGQFQALDVLAQLEDAFWLVRALPSAGAFLSHTWGTRQTLTEHLVDNGRRPLSHGSALKELVFQGRRWTQDPILATNGVAERETRQLCREGQGRSVSV